ncbi:hypothetical protein CTI12_AA549660 [Artemisia annua]|uniref:C3H1-type domain-containing protein n=1 Tax=Artemisia annua TaxID=35608 RepID=A0A2U1KYS7_ARTAN|nr:hypothetical protein CTI12_AA549660 [Artemisia annua]
MAHEVWKKLRDLFHDNKAARVIQLDNEIRNMAIGTLSVNDYFQEIKSKADRLANLGSVVSDSSLVTYAINGLRVKFPEITRIIRHRETLPTFDQVRSMVLLEESDMAQLTSAFSNLNTTSSSPTVLVATNSNTPKPGTVNNVGIELCRNFQRGSCTYGSRCKFSHGTNDSKPCSTNSGASSHNKSPGSYTPRVTQTNAPSLHPPAHASLPHVVPFNPYNMQGMGCVNPFMYLQTAFGPFQPGSYTYPNSY